MPTSNLTPISPQLNERTSNSLLKKGAVLCCTGLHPVKAGAQAPFHAFLDKLPSGHPTTSWSEMLEEKRSETPFSAFVDDFQVGPDPADPRRT